MIHQKTKIFPFPASVFFLGIGGIGVSALAKLALNNGIKVSGIDLVQSDIIDDLKRQGAKISITKHDNFSISQFLNFSPDLIIYSTAVPFNNPILTQARKLKIPIKSYPQALGQISKSHYTIAVSGMHGKSTTTAMIGLMLESAGLDPLVIVGTKVPQWKSNLRVQSSKFKVQSCSLKLKVKIQNGLFVVEADEYRSAMLNLSPDIIVLTRIEEDHLDYYKNIDHIKREFRKYLKKLTDAGCAIVNWGDENIRSIARLPARRRGGLNCSIVKYNYKDDKIIEKIQKILKVSGRHNLENALAAYKVGEKLGLTQKQILTGLAKFKGTWRRMELVGKCQMSNVKCQIKSKCQIPIISDYAHHPTEIKATLQALREKYTKKRILLAYQPHQRNRTKMLFKDFINAFDQADVLVLNEIFDVAGREASADQDVSSRDLCQKIKKKIQFPCSIVRLPARRIGGFDCYYTKTLSATKTKILELAKPNDIIVIMGAGDIDKIAREMACQKL